MSFARFLAAVIALHVCAFPVATGLCQTQSETFAVRFAEANEYAAQHRWAEAIAAYEQAIHLDTRHSEGFNRLGEAYLAVGQYKDALKAFRRATGIDHTGPEGLCNVGRTLVKLHRYADAVDAYWVAVGAAPDYAPARFALAETYLKLGKKDIALLQQEKLKELDQKLAARLFDDIFFRKATDVERDDAAHR